MPFIIDVQTCFPENYYTQDEITEFIISAWDGRYSDFSTIRNIHRNTRVGKRHLALPMEHYSSLESFDEKNRIFIEKSTELACGAINNLFACNSIGPGDISSLWSNTVTGFAIPSLDARVMNIIDFRYDTKRIPLLGLGCMAGAAGINRAADYLTAYPDEAVIFFSVELCSLTFQIDNVSIENIISTGLFGDGAAAVLMAGDSHPLACTAPLEWIGSSSAFFRNSETMMGWDVGEKGLKIILNRDVPAMTETMLPKPLYDFLESHDRNINDISEYFAHPGGPRVLRAIEKVLDLAEGELINSWQSLNENGNMSSVSILDIFKRYIDCSTTVKQGQAALSLAMGPAFSAEIGLFKWC